MKLVSYRNNGSVRAGAIVSDAQVLDLHAADSRIPSELIDILGGGEPVLQAVRDAISAQSGNRSYLSDLAQVALQAPLPRPGKVMAIGRNYFAHAQEQGAEVPPYPIVFPKFATCITGPGAPVEVPKVSTQVDWEGELVVVIGRRGRHIAAADAMNYVAGYMNGNDVSVRDFQKHTPTWTMGKNFDTHGPTGPWILTRDEAPEPDSFELRTWVNGVLKQDGHTRDLMYNIPVLIEYISTAMTLEPGDLIFTGTPSGVGQARDPQEWLAPGDKVRVEITGLGVLENPVIAEA